MGDWDLEQNEEKNRFLFAYLLIPLCLPLPPSDSVEPSSDVVSMVTHTLHFLLLLELLRPDVLSEFPPGSRLARIMCTFLIGRYY